MQHTVIQGLTDARKYITHITGYKRNGLLHSLTTFASGYLVSHISTDDKSIT